MQCSNYDKMRKTLLFSSVPTNLFPFLTKESQNKIQTFLSENALNKGFTEESLDFSKVGISGKIQKFRFFLPIQADSGLIVPSLLFPPMVEANFEKTHRIKACGKRHLR